MLQVIDTIDESQPGFSLAQTQLGSLFAQVAYQFLLPCEHFLIERAAQRLGVGQNLVQFKLKSCRLQQRSMVAQGRGVAGRGEIALPVGEGEPRAGFQDAHGLHVLPGVLDSHTHWGYRGDFGVQCRSDSRAAAIGGVTTALLLQRMQPGQFGKLKQQGESLSVIDFIFSVSIFNEAIAACIEEALRCKETGEEKVILTALCGHGLLDLTAYSNYQAGQVQDFDLPMAAVQEALSRLPAAV